MIKYMHWLVSLVRYLHTYLFKGKRKKYWFYYSYIFLLLSLKGLEPFCNGILYILEKLVPPCSSLHLSCNLQIRFALSKFCVFLVPIKILVPYEYQNQCWYVLQISTESMHLTEIIELCIKLMLHSFQILLMSSEKQSNVSMMAV